MKANELRIGNLIYSSSGGVKYVVGTSYKTILHSSSLESYTYYEDYDSNCEPIPLTEEILLKCGFELTDVKTHSDNRPLTKMFYKKTLLVQHHDNGLWSFIIMGYNIVRPEMSQFLHQLQNLYFALTNEELTFNNL